MRPYWAVLVARFRVMLQYRAAALAGFGTQLFWGLIRVMIFEAFYRSSTATQPMTYPQTVSYLWLVQAMLLLMPMRLDPEISSMIRDGTVAYELARPTDLYWFWYSRRVASILAPMLLRAVPMFVVAGLFLGLHPPASVFSGVAWLLSTVGALLLSSALTTLTTISLMWTMSGQGISRLVLTLTFLFSGALVPLPLLPDWTQSVINALPFRGLMDIPFRLYVGQIPPQNAGALLAHQLAWTAALILVGRLVLSRGTRRLVIQGG